ncbi:hypothetical protein TIFTF001_006544 [Ficus carica]|uniref:Acid phosphatase n=1 Tax=Ficus carica TaxID=3494 RepID=A0AA87ZPJ9_FICCA|nr:hypothetical protein TIFTF001_006544 [Ficus carica]
MLLFFFLATLLGATTAQAGILYPTIIKKGEHLRPQSNARRSASHGGEPCKSWQFAIETHNLIDWKTVPNECELFVGRYLLGDQYAEDSKVVTREAFKFALSFNKSYDGFDIWIFAIDETALSNLPYYASRGFGTEPFDSKAFDKWVKSEDAPALSWTLKLYRQLQLLGYKIVFLTGRREYKREATHDNLLVAGYRNWDKLIHKPSDYNGSALDYKSDKRQQLVDAGYRIVGNVGDQWSDLLGTNHGTRNFKLPNPLYYVI